MGVFIHRAKRIQQYQHLIINDKIYGKGGQGPNNPYGVYLKTGNTSSTDKWNPADIIAIKTNKASQTMKLLKDFDASKVSKESAAVKKQN